MRLVSRQAATGGSSSHRKWWQGGLARSLFNTPTTQLQYATGTNSLVQLDTSLESGNGIGELVSIFFRSTFWLCLSQMLADKAESNCKGSCAPAPPRSTHLRGSSGSDMEQACIWKHLDPLACLAVWFCSLQREHYSSMLDTVPALPHGPRNSQQGPK